MTDRPIQVIDIGAGAGFPGLPLKLIRPRIGLALVDSVGKKTAFLTDLIHHLNLEATTVVTARAEDLARQPAYREQYDVALARAVAPAPVLVEYALPFLRVGGRLIAQKTAGKGPDELASCQRACALLGGGPPRLVPVTLSSPADDAPAVARHLPAVQQALAGRVLLVVDKQHPTPDRYPRRPGLPAKRPL